MNILRLAFLLIWALFGISGKSDPLSFSAESTPVPTNYTSVDARTYVDSLVANASLKEKIGQLFFVPVEGRFLSQDDHTFKEISDLITEDHIGGIIFMRGDIYGQAVLTNKLQALSTVPLWITQDMEFGAAMRISGTTRFTPAMGVAATGNKQNAYLMGKITAKEAAALGVHQIFAPVLDVNNNPDNPVINVRSFSGDPQVVAEYGVAFMQGVQSENIVSTAKHFPGHGDTDTDSHLSLPVLDHDYTRLDSVELIPFRAAIDNGIRSVMSAHISFPKISTDPEMPGTLDASILGDILMDSLNFRGIVVTDGLEMSGITKKFSPGRAVVRALNAGADVMLISPDIHTAIAEVLDAVAKGEITEQRINESYRKILEWKQQAGLIGKINQVNITDLDKMINTQEHEAIASKIARESVTIVKNNNDLLPLNPNRHKKILLVSVADDESGETGSAFARSLRNYHPNIDFEVFDGRSDQGDAQQILDKARSADLVMIASYIGLRFAQEIQLSGKQSTFLRRLTALGKPSVLVMFGNPYLVAELAATDAHVMGWASTNLQMSAVAPALFGASAVNGRLPIEIPGMYAVGDGISYPQTNLRYGEPEEVGLQSQKLFALDHILRDAVLDSVFPGAVAAVVKDGVMVYRHAEGYHDYEKLKKVRTDDVYDLASITKVISTTTAIMKLIDEGSLSLDDFVSNYISEFDTDEKRSITIRHLLLHESGLPAFRVYVDELQKRNEIISAIKNESLINPVGEKYVYSDLGMILLAEIVGIVTGRRIDGYVRSEFYAPMGMYGTYFNPKNVSRWYVNRIPPTEEDNVYRMKRIQAEVNDERAWYLDGIAGHAGLFSTVDDLAKFGTMLLNNGIYNDERYLSEEVIQLFTSQQSELSGRGLGFDRRSASGFTSAGQLSSSDTFGHLGFTGTSFWIDRKKNMIVILLSNRTYPSRTYGKKISTIRAEVADAAFSALINRP
jgi:beta-glucosidase-like glycosyl hydrolase/CubicO group peptidase (beta-lactamase class C family)